MATPWGIRVNVSALFRIRAYRKTASSKPRARAGVSLLPASQLRLALISSRFACDTSLGRRSGSASSWTAPLRSQDVLNYKCKWSTDNSRMGSDPLRADPEPVAEKCLERADRTAAAV